MGIYKRPDSVFWWILLEGTNRRESTHIPVDGGTDHQTTRNKQLAKAAYAAKMGDLARGRYGLEVELPVIGVREYRAWYLDQVSVHKRNLLREKSMLGKLGEHFDRLALHELTKDRAQEWMTARRLEVSAATVKRELELLRSVLSSAIPTYLTEHPLKGFPGKGQLRIVEYEPRILTHDEEARLLKVLTDSQDYAVIVCALDTLMRLSDVVNLQRGADHGRYITVVDPKTKTYKVPVSARLRKALDRLTKNPETKNSPWVFPKYHAWTPYKGPRKRRWEEKERKGRDRGRGGTRAAQLAVVRMFEAACALAGIPHGRYLDVVDQAGRRRRTPSNGVTFHSLRHTGASRALENGADVRTVQELGGWTNLKQLTRYTHPTEQAKQRAVDSIGKKKKAG